MSDIHVGKLSPDRMNALIAGRLGASDSRIIMGPGAGLDFGVTDCGNGRVMAIAEEPIFPAAGLRLEMMGEFTVHIGASDVAVSGIRPEFMTYSLLLPPGTPVEETEKIIQKISDTAKSLDIAIVGGHTGWYSAVSLPIVGGITVWGFAGKDEWVSPGGARPGDALLMTKGPAIEAAALLGVLYSQKDTPLPPETVSALLGRVSQITVVEDALTAWAAGGVHAMHDATEGGVYGGMWEMKNAAGAGLEAVLSRDMVPADIQALADYLSFDPWTVISEGTLLAAVSPGSVEAVRAAWSKKGIKSEVVGTFTDGRSSLVRDGRETGFPEPETDPFWNLFDNALK